jgi:hypothetical protein
LLADRRKRILLAQANAHSQGGEFDPIIFAILLRDPAPPWCSATRCRTLAAS